jgi:hypothetical protein
LGAGEVGEITYMVAGEGLPFDDDFPPVGCRSVEARHEQMQVRCQGLHDHDFAGKCANDFRCLLLGCVVEVQPWWQAAVVVCEVAEDTLGSPRIQVPVDIVSCSPRLQAKRVAAEIYRLFVVVVGLCHGVGTIRCAFRFPLEPILLVLQIAFCGNDKLFPELAQCILLILLLRKRLRAKLRVSNRLIRIPGPWHIHCLSEATKRVESSNNVCLRGVEKPETAQGQHSIIYKMTALKIALRAAG